MADTYSMFSALSDVTEDLSELTLRIENEQKKQKAASIHETSHNKHHKKNNSNSSNLLTPPWEKKHNRRSLSDGNWNIKKENPSKTEKNTEKSTEKSTEKNNQKNTEKNNTLKPELPRKNNDLSRTPSLPSKWSIKRATLYKTEMCRAFEETGKCKFGDECIFAHSEEELRPRVDRHPKYKTRLCRTFWEQGECPYGKRCCFIHTERDITHPDDFSVFEAQMQQQQLTGNLSTSLLNGNHRRMQSAPEIAHKHRPSNSSDTFMGGIYSLNPLDRRSINSEKSSIRSFDTTKESSKLKEEIKIDGSESESEEENTEEKQTPSVILLDETGSVTEIIRKPKKTQRISKFLKVGGHKNNSNNNLDVKLNNDKVESTEGKNKSKWFSRNKNNQNNGNKEKKSNESSTGRKILSFGRKDKDKEKDKDNQNEVNEKEKEKEKEKHFKSFIPFVRIHKNESNENVDSLFAPSAISTNLSIPPPLPSPLVENTSSNMVAADALFGNTEPAASVDETKKTDQAATVVPIKETKEKDKKKNKKLTIEANPTTKTDEITSPRRSFFPTFLLSAITKSNSNSGSNNNKEE